MGTTNVAIQAVYKSALATNGALRQLQADNAGALLVAGGVFDASVQFITSEAAYAAGDVVGTTPVGVIALPAHMHLGDGAGTQKLNLLMSVAVWDSGGVAADLSFLFFNVEPVGVGATLVDNTSPSFSTDNRDSFLGKVDIAGADYLSAGGEAMAAVSNLGLSLSAPNGGIYVVCVVKSGAPDWAAGDVLAVRVGITNG